MIFLTLMVFDCQLKDFATCFTFLYVFVGRNVIEHPDDMKFRKLRKVSISLLTVIRGTVFSIGVCSHNTQASIHNLW